MEKYSRNKLQSVTLVLVWKEDYFKCDAITQYVANHYCIF
jgi:hypothetical protein